MKNMKVKRKLIISFLIVAILAAAVGITGIIGMNQLSAAADTMYEEQTKPLSYISSLTTYLQRMRVGMREYALGVAADNEQKIDSAKTTIDSIKTEITSGFNLYDPTIADPEARKLFDEAVSLFNGAYMDYLDSIYNAAKAHDLDTCLQILSDATATVNTIVDNLDACMQIRIDAASETNQLTTNLSFSLLIIIVVVLVIAVCIAIGLALYVSSIISTPLTTLTDFMNKAGSTGDITLRPEDSKAIESYGNVKDEIGQCIGSTGKFVSHIAKIAEFLEIVASGDLTPDVSLLSDKDTMGLSLQKMIANLNSMFSEINSSTAQVASGSKQIADGAQSLAQGSTEQAAAVQQLSSSISEIAQKTKVNSEMANKAAKLGDSIKSNADKGSRQMDEMMSAVKDINLASQSINKVIKVIDDIAFQTNILALNAAVEAARAGQHGKGFAVVSEEVRSLAAKSAEAAKDTGNLIANSMEKAELGARIADETAASLVEIVSGINESSQLVAEIAKSSEEQSAGIAQVNTGIDQVAQVVQQNSATAEQSAAASQEMSGQSFVLEELISRFKLKGGAPMMSSSSLSAPEPRRLSGPASVKPTDRSHLPSDRIRNADSGSFGKY